MLFRSIGIYPPKLIPQIRDRLAYHGAQRLVTLGYVATKTSLTSPQDGIEPVRRMCKWIANEVHDSAETAYWPWPDEVNADEVNAAATAAE